MPRLLNSRWIFVAQKLITFHLLFTGSLRGAPTRRWGYLFKFSFICLSFIYLVFGGPQTPAAAGSLFWARDPFPKGGGFQNWEEDKINKIGINWRIFVRKWEESSPNWLMILLGVHERTKTTPFFSSAWNFWDKIERGGDIILQLWSVKLRA